MNVIVLKSLNISPLFSEFPRMAATPAMIVAIFPKRVLENSKIKCFA